VRSKLLLAILSNLRPTLGLAYHLRLSTPHIIMGLWSGLSLHHRRCHTYSLYGTQMLPLAQVSSGLPSAWVLPAAKFSPIQCDPLYRFSQLGQFPVKAPGCTPLCALKGRCSIQLSYGRLIGVTVTGIWLTTTLFWSG
jgi:hypothetical protein